MLMVRRAVPLLCRLVKSRCAVFRVNISAPSTNTSAPTTNTFSEILDAPSTTAASFTVLPGLESLGAVEILLPTVTLGVPSRDVSTTFSLPGPFSRIQITIPAGSWVARRRSNGRPLTATVFSLTGGGAGSGGLPGTACGPAVDLGPHDVALAAPLLLSLPCTGAPPDPAATPAIYGLAAGRWAAFPPPATGPTYANGTVWARPAALTAQAAFWILPPPSAATASGPAAGLIAGAVLGAAACCLAASAAAWWLRARRSRLKVYNCGPAAKEGDAAAALLTRNGPSAADALEAPVLATVRSTPRMPGAPQ